MIEILENIQNNDPSTRCEDNVLTLSQASMYCVAAISTKVSMLSNLSLLKMFKSQLAVLRIWNQDYVYCCLR